MAKASSIRKTLLGALFILILVISISQIQSTYAQEDEEDEEDEEDDDEDFAKDLGYVSIGLFVVSGITIIIYFTNKYSRRLLKGEEAKTQETRDWISKNFRKIRKPLNYIHYLVGFGALTVLLIHGIYLSAKDEALVVIGWITTAFYSFYVLSGLIIWLKIKPFWNFKKAMKIMNKIHRSFILFIGIVVIHIIHVIMAD
jgi:hypothetical protein